MDKALPSGGRDCGFESRLELFVFHIDFNLIGGSRSYQQQLGIYVQYRGHFKGT